jgi:heterodisulfide reductase subunit A
MPMGDMGDVVVIGAGIAGIQAALDLANHGIVVHLIEREPSIGGHMAQLDKTFPTNDCSMCILSPRMAEVAHHENIRIYTCSEVEAIDGGVGNFMVTVKKNPRYIDESLCNGCGDCIQICPVEVYNRFDAGIGIRKAIYKPQPQSVPDIVIKDPDHCIECGLCYDVCGLDAIRKKDEGGVIRIPAASIVVASGYSVFDAGKKTQFGHLVLPDVITSIELERMINASGPTGGKVMRMSNGKIPESVVFIQCVGSRDMSLNRPYCSCVCCMQAVKNAMLIKEKYPETEVSICYIDIRAYGKGYEEYFERAKSMGITFLHGMPSDVLTDRDGMIIQVENTETGELLVLHPDLVVLSVGIGPADDSEKIAQRLGIPIEETGFVKPVHDAVETVATIRPGIYVAGTATAPKDIPDSVAQAGSAAMLAFIDAIRT